MSPVYMIVVEILIKVVVKIVVEIIVETVVEVDVEHLAAPHQVAACRCRIRHRQEVCRCRKFQAAHPIAAHHQKQQQRITVFEHPNIPPIMCSNLNLQH